MKKLNCISLNKRGKVRLNILKPKFKKFYKSNKYALLRKCIILHSLTVVCSYKIKLLYIKNNGYYHT